MQTNHYRRRQQRGGDGSSSSVAPKLPLKRSFADNNARDPLDDGTSEGMGIREDTSAFPLRQGEVRVPKERPPVIFGRWASVTQTGEVFPQAEFSPIPSPATHQQPNAHLLGDEETMGANDAMEEMEKHVSNMLLEAEEAQNAQADLVSATPLSSSSQIKTSNVPSSPACSGAPRVPVDVVLIGAPTGVGMLKRISEHHPRFLFAPPPPPMPDMGCLSSASSYTPLMRKKMMRWFQIVELWCIERSAEVVDDAADSAGTSRQLSGKEVADHERAITAPPPRPPMFTEHVAPELEHRKWLVDVARPHAPYSTDQWIDRCRVWWARIMFTFDKLRDEGRYSGFQHVSKGPPARRWTARDATTMIA